VDGTIVVQSLNPVPTITSLSPISATAGGPAFTLTVNGDNFVSGSTVQWGGSVRTTTFISSTQLTATITASDITTAGTVSVTVVSPAPGGGRSNTLPFVVVQHSTAITVTLVPPSRTITAGESIAYTVWATDTFGNGWDATSMAAYAMTPDAGGSWAGSVYTSECAGTWAVTATVHGTVGMAGLTVLPGGPASIALVADPTTLAVGGTAALTATVRDEQTNPVPGAVVTFTTADSLGTGSITPITDITDAEGQARSSASSSSTGLKTITADAGTGVTTTAGIIFTPGLAHRIELTVSSDTLIASSSATAIVTATAYDALDNPLSGEVVMFTVSDPSLGTVGPGGVSNAAGQVVATWTAGTIVQTGLITATSGGISTSAPVTLTFGPLDHFGFAFIADRIAGTPFTLAITAYDAYSNVVAFSGMVALTDTSGTISPTISGNFVSGAWSGLVSIGVGATDVVITATDKLISGTSNPFTVNNPAPTVTDLNPVSAAAGGPAFPLTVNGTHFVGGSTVHWDGAARATTFVSSTQLTAAITASDIATAGTINVTVVNPTPGGGTSNALPFEVAEIGPIPPTTYVYLPLISSNAEAHLRTYLPLVLNTHQGMVRRRRTFETWKVCTKKHP